jgi:hypothetical protein
VCGMKKNETTLPKGGQNYKKKKENEIQQDKQWKKSKEAIIV